MEMSDESSLIKFNVIESSHYNDLTNIPRIRIPKLQNSSQNFHITKDLYNIIRRLRFIYHHHIYKIIKPNLLSA